MSGEIPILDKIADVVLAYRPPAKKKKLAAKARKVDKKKKDKDPLAKLIQKTTN